MYYVTQVNVPAPDTFVCNSIEEARTVAGEQCPNGGDAALIYELVAVERVSTHTCTDFDSLKKDDSSAFTAQPLTKHEEHYE